MVVDVTTARGFASWMAVVVLATVLLAAASGSDRATPEPPSVGEVSEPMRLGVIGFYNPRLMYLRYQPLIDYLSDRGGVPWRLAIGKSYSETVRELRVGTVDVAYLGPLTYVRAHEEFGALPVVRLNTFHRAWYRSTIVVADDSPIRSLADLAHGRLAFGPLLSTSSNLVPRLMLAADGVDVRGLAVCPSFPHHDKAARAVFMGEVDAAAVRDLVGERFTHRGLRILAQSQPIPNFPLVVHPERMPHPRADAAAVAHRPPAQRSRGATDDVRVGSGAGSGICRGGRWCLRLRPRVGGGGVRSASAQASRG